jgi:hypothetical protein
MAVTKDEFVKNVAARLGADPKHVAGTVDATLSQLVEPSIFGTGAAGLRADNNCGNGCGSAEALKTAKAPTT